MSAAEYFEKNRYVVMKNAFPAVLVNFAYQYMVMKVQSGQALTNDTLVPDTPYMYADLVMETLMAMAQPMLEENLDIKLFPTYSFCRLYKQGDILPPHSDRPACEISVTVCLGSNSANMDDPDYRWPIFVDNSMDYTHEDELSTRLPLSGEGTAINLSPGDCLVYRGCEVRHWREAFPGNQHAQAFLHYVNQDGPYADLKFDRRARLGTMPVPR